MNDEIFKKILLSKKERLPMYCIEAIMDEELEKSTTEMDTDLIERCLDALTEKGSSQPKIKLYKSIVARILVFFTVATIIIFFSYPALFTYLHVPMSDFMKNIYFIFFDIIL